jgi:hypothetical protein
MPAFSQKKPFSTVQKFSMSKTLTFITQLHANTVGSFLKDPQLQFLTGRKEVE